MGTDMEGLRHEFEQCASCEIFRNQFKKKKVMLEKNKTKRTVVTSAIKPSFEGNVSQLDSKKKKNAKIRSKILLHFTE